MPTPSQSRRLARRAAARAPRVTGYDGRPDLTCPRCKLRMGRGVMGTECTYWHGVGRKRTEITQRVCPACSLEIRRAGAGGSLGMHGAAYTARVKQAQPWRYGVTEVTPGSWARWLAARHVSAG